MDKWPTSYTFKPRDYSFFTSSLQYTVVSLGVYRPQEGLSQTYKQKLYIKIIAIIKNNHY